jgi:hypothetical protein
MTRPGGKQPKSTAGKAMTAKSNSTFVMMSAFIAVFIGFNAYGKRLPFRNFHYSVEYAQYQYDDFEEIKGFLTIDLLRGNDISSIIEKFSRAQNILARLAAMPLDEHQRNAVRRYLLTFFQEYLHDSRFQQLLAALDINPPEKSLDETLFYYEIIAMPSNILCTISALNPAEAEIEKIADFLENSSIVKSFKEQYIVTFFSDLFYFKHGHKVKKYLDEHSFSDFSRKNQKRMDGFRIALLANKTENQKDTWQLFFQKHQIAANSIKLDTVNFDHEIFELNQTFTQVFLAQYPTPDYLLLVELSKNQAREDQFFFMLQLYQLTMHHASDTGIENDTKAIIDDTMKEFLENNKNPASPVNRKIYKIIDLNDQFRQKSMK